jgi:Protein of unknown function (DUF3575)
MMIRRAVVTLGVLVASPALAQPGPDDPPPPPPPDIIVLTPAPAAPPAPIAIAPPATAVPAPQNEPWSNVSHINGHPVPVGERGDFLYAHKTTSISTNPIGWLLGFYGVSITHAVSQNVAIRGDVNFIEVTDSNTQGYEVGGSAPIYFKRVFHGPFIEPGIIVRDFDSSSEFTDHRPSIGPSIVFGWHWTFDSGLNVAAAIGVMRNMNHEQTEYGGNDTIEPSGYFRVGYAF